MRKIIRKSAYIGVLLFVFSGVISCEEDFTDIGTSIVGNTKFNTGTIILEVEVTQRNIEAIRGDNISIASVGEFLLGVYQDPTKQYEKIEASFVSQIALAAGVDVTDGVTDTTTVTSVFDYAFLKFPYIATQGDDNADGTPTFTLDSLLGTTISGVTLNVYRNNTFLNTLDPQNPSQSNSFSSDFAYDKGEQLAVDFKFIPNDIDTIYEYDRTLKSGVKIKDTLKLVNANPFLVIPLDKTLMKSLFYDKFEDTEFESQEALTNYFRGIIIEASGTENSLIPLSFIGDLIPTLEVNYTNTVENTATGVVTDTIKKMASFPISGVQNRIYKMTPESNGVNTEQVIIQGAAGKAADVKILQGTQLEELKAKDWLINDATLTFYIDQNRDTTAIPLRLHLYKEEPNYAAQIKDAYSEGFDVFSGVLEKDGVKNDSYSFKITDYISDVLGPAATKNSNLVLKVYNTTDIPVQNNALDTIITNYSWNPRAVTLTNHLPNNGVIEGTRKAQLKISYSEKKN